MVSDLAPKFRLDTRAAPRDSGFLISSLRKFFITEHRGDDGDKIGEHAGERSLFPRG